MGCAASWRPGRRGAVSAMPSSSWRDAIGKETVLAALARLDQDIANSEKFYPAQRLAVITAELQSIRQEIKEFEDIPSPAGPVGESYSKTLHQMFVNLDLYRRPMLAAENEDFVANVNRKEMRRLELSWLRRRESDLQRERRLLHAQLLRIRGLYSRLQQLTTSVWRGDDRPQSQLEEDLERSHSLRDALAGISMRLRAAAEYAHCALRLIDDALPAWKLASIGKNGWERTVACGDACQLLVQARCQERGARRVLAAPAAPRAARAVRLVLDYAFTDTMNDHKHQRATEAFLQFKGALVQLVNSIQQVLLNNVENLAAAEKELAECRRKLKTARANAIVSSGLADLNYDPATLEQLKGVNKST